MEIKVNVKRLEDVKTEALVIGIFEGSRELDKNSFSWDKALGGSIREALESGDFKGKLNQTYLIPAKGKIPAARVLLVGLGKEKEFVIDRLRQASGKSAAYLSTLGLESFNTTLHLLHKPLYEASQAVLEGTVLALYRFDT